MPTYTQESRLLAIGTPLGDDVLLLRAISGTEELGRPFNYTLDLLSENPEINFDDIVGQNCTVRIERPDGSTRFINGYIARFIQTESRGRLASYRATLVPWLWFLTRSADCRIHSPREGSLKTIPEIVEQVFRDRGFTDFRTSGLTESYEARDFCVQYRETDFNFVSRLLEQEGIYYYFEHENGKHTLVLSDSTASHPEALGGCATLPYLPDAGNQVHQERVTEWTIEKDVRPTIYAHTDFDPLLPTNALLTTTTVQRSHAGAGAEIFDYPGEYVQFSDGERLAKVRLEEYQARHELLRARTDARSLAAGYAFTLSGHPREDQNRKHLIVSVDLYAESDAYDADPHRGGAPRDLFRCAFTAIPFTQAFRPARTTPKPLISGPQTAIVAGSSAKEVVTDEHGRVKVKFHWDRDSAGDDNSSCFIRVAQGWAGKKWGMMFLPRIGQEVVVEFLEGDPDRPLITGSVYNGDCKPPYDLPANKTVSTIKSDSSEGSGGYNELRFEDKKDSEQVFLHAQRRLDLRVRANHYETTGGSREIRVGHEDKGDLNAFVHKDVNKHLKGGEFEMVEKKLNQTVKEDVVEDYQLNQTSVIKERLNLNAKEIAAEASDALTLKSGKVVAQGGDSATVKAGTVYVEGTQAIHLKSGGNFVLIDAAGVTIQGSLVKINSGGAAQAGQAPLDIPEPTIEDPIEAAAAATAVPGQRTTGGGSGRSRSSRTRTPRTVPLRRAPEPPPPPAPGTIGWGSSGGQQNVDEIELVEVVEVVKEGGADKDKPVQTRKQYVNLDPADNHPEYGRKVRLRAKVRWKTGDPNRSLAGQEVHWYITPDGANRASLKPAGCKHGWQVEGGPRTYSVKTDAQGWTPVVDMFVSQYGGDKFDAHVTLDKSYTGGLHAGNYTVWRRLFFEVDHMGRVGGGTYADVSQKDRTVAGFANLFIELVETGSDNSPPYQRVLTGAEKGAWSAAPAVRDGSGSPRYFHLILVDTITRSATADAQRSFTVKRGRYTIPFSADAYVLDARDWFVSATWRDKVTGATGAITADKFSALTEAGTYAGNDDRFVTSGDLSGIGSAPGNDCEVVITVKNHHALSGVQSGPATIIGMRWREKRYAGDAANLADSILHTMLHEPAHAMGMAAVKAPDGATNPDTYYKAGHHCHNLGDTCIMYGVNSPTTVFCPVCADALRGRKLTALPMAGDAAYG